MSHQPQMLVLSPAEWQQGEVPVCHSLLEWSRVWCHYSSMARLVCSASPSPLRHSPAQSSHRSGDKPGLFLVLIQSRSVIHQTLSQPGEASVVDFQGHRAVAAVSYLPQLHIFIWLLAFVALQVQIYTVSLLWEHADCRYGQFQSDHTLLGKHKFMFWKGSLLLLPGRLCQGALNDVYAVSHINEFKARLGANSNSLVSLSI